MRLILGIEDGHDIASRHLQSQVQPVWLSDRIIIIDQQLDIWITEFVDLCLGLGDGARIILATDGDDLQQFFRIVEIVHLLNSLAVDPLLVLSRQKNGEGEARILVNRWGVVEPRMFWLLPDVKAQAYIEDGLKDHQQDDKKKEYKKKQANKTQNHYISPTKPIMIFNDQAGTVILSAAKDLCA